MGKDHMEQIVLQSKSSDDRILAMCESIDDCANSLVRKDSFLRSKDEIGELLSQPISQLKDEVIDGLRATYNPNATFDIIDHQEMKRDYHDLKIDIDVKKVAKVFGEQFCNIAMAAISGGGSIFAQLLLDNVQNLCINGYYCQDSTTDIAEKVLFSED